MKFPEQSARNPELATMLEVREFNTLAHHLVDEYGRIVHAIFNNTKQAVFALVDAEGELLIREIPPIPEAGEKEAIVRAIFARIVHQHEDQKVWHVVSIETEGDNPRAVDAKDTYLDLNAASTAKDAIRAFERLVKEDGHTVEDPTDDDFFASAQININPKAYGSEFHALTMKVLRNIKSASLSPNRPIET